MKNSIVLSILLSLSTITFAQNYKGAVGIKYNYSTLNFLVLEVNGKYFFANKHAIDVNLGLNKRCIWSQLNYQFIGNIDGGLDWYTGGGLDFGRWLSESSSRQRGLRSGDSWFGLNMLAGVEYTFDYLPLNLAFDTGPSIQLHPNAGFGWNASFTIRYTFK